MALFFIGCSSNSSNSEKVQKKTFNESKCHYDKEKSSNLILDVSFADKTKEELETEVLVQANNINSIRELNFQAEDNLIWFYCINDGHALEQIEKIYSYTVTLNQ